MRYVLSKIVNKKSVCSFLIGSDGNVYEGAGWHKVGAHTRGYNTRSMGVALIGNFQSTLHGSMDRIGNIT